MGFFNRLKNIISAKANKALDGVENPIEQYELSIKQKEELIIKAKQEYAKFKSNITVIEQETSKLKKEIKDYENGAEKAGKEQNLEMCKRFITKKKEVENILNSKEITIKDLSEKAEIIKNRIESNEKQVKELKERVREFSARSKSAEIGSKLSEMLNNADDGLNTNLDEFERKLAEKEGYADALNDFKKEDDELKEYMSTANSSEIEDELAKYGFGSKEDKIE